MTQFGFYFDQSRCIGCNACAVACKQWHDLPPGPQKWMRVYKWETGGFPDIRVHTLVVPCYHCERPACLKVCPNKAISKENRFGAVLIDPSKCHGTRKCWSACPYGAIVFPADGQGEKASKCTMCIDRLNEGKKPICVLSCSMRALEFGPLQELINRFGRIRRLSEMPSEDITGPSVIFRPSEPKRQVIAWDSGKALVLWRKRRPHEREDAVPLFEKIEDVTTAAAHAVGRNRLVLKAKNSEELMYYTTDDD